jgi:NADH pyrophosphatase NudC (nudix superfamily)
VILFVCLFVCLFVFTVWLDPSSLMIAFVCNYVFLNYQKRQEKHNRNKKELKESNGFQSDEWR